MTIDQYMIAARLVHIAALMLLSGTLFLRLYARPRTATVPPDTTAAFAEWQRRFALGCTIVAALGALLWWDSLAASMSDDFSSAYDPAILSKVLFRTQFGRVWIWRLALSAALIATLAVRRPPSRLADLATAAMAAALVVTLAATGHAAIHLGLGGQFHQVADALHLLCAGLWIGGLAALAVIFVRAARSPAWAALGAYVLPRFSRIGYGAVALLFATGLVNASFLVSPGNLFTTAYGLLLVAKVSLFLLMTTLALVNRAALMPRLFAARAGEAPAPLRALRNSIAVELALALAVVAVVAALGALPPAH